MNRNARFGIVLTIALAVAGAASFVLYRVVSSIPVREVEVASLQAVVAARSIPVGTIVTKDHLKLVAWPARSPVPGSFTEIDKVVNRGFVIVDDYALAGCQKAIHDFRRERAIADPLIPIDQMSVFWRKSA